VHFIHEFTGPAGGRSDSLPGRLLATMVETSKELKGSNTDYGVAELRRC
jgi:hypothetical protein